MRTLDSDNRRVESYVQARLQRLMRLRWRRASDRPCDLLAARLPDGSAWREREVPMWKRSEVERLTGLTRHMIQDLCNQNVSGDGLGFWEPAVSKPGYSRFDEGDLLAFYLVRQLTKAGFTLREVEPAVFDLLEEGDAFTEALRVKEQRLRERQSKIDASLQALSYLEDAAVAAPDERLQVVMAGALEQSLQWALAAAAQDARSAGEVLPPRGQAHVARQARMVIAEIVVAIQGDMPQRLLDVVGDTLGEEAVCSTFVRLSERLAGLLEAGEMPDSRSAATFSWALASCLAGQVRGDGSGESFKETSGRRVRTVPANACATRCYALRALARFLSEPENGVPVELVLGNGSFSYLAQATAACVNELDKVANEKEG